MYFNCRQKQALGNYWSTQSDMPATPTVAALSDNPTPAPATTSSSSTAKPTATATKAAPTASVVPPMGTAAKPK